MKKAIRFQIYKNAEVRNEESVRIPRPADWMLIEAKLGREYSGMGYIVVRDTKNHIRLQRLLGHGERKMLIGGNVNDTTVGGIPGQIEAGEWKVELYLFTEYIEQFLGDRTAELVVTVETPQTERKAPEDVKDVIGDSLWVSAGQQGNVPELDIFRKDCMSSEESRWYKGDFHTHTTLSDGKETIVSAMEKAKQTGMDFYVPTEHNLVHTGWTNTEMTILPGIEITTERGHCNFFGIDKMPECLPELMAHMNDSQAERLMYEAVEEARERGWIVSINHPFLHIWKWKHGALPLRDVDCVEIVNDPTYNYAKESNDRAIEFLDLLWEDGWNIWGVGGSDSHNLIEERYDGAELPSIAGDPGTYVYCNGLSPENLVREVRSGHMYVSRFCSLKTDIRDEERSYLPGDEIVCRGKAAKIEYQVTVMNIGKEVKGAVYIYAVRDGARELLETVKHPDGSYTAGTWAVFDEEGRSWMRIEVRTASGEFLAYVNPVYHGSCGHKYVTFADAAAGLEA